MVTCCKLPATSTANNILTIPPGRQEAKNIKKQQEKGTDLSKKRSQKELLMLIKKTKYKIHENKIKFRLKAMKVLLKERKNLKTKTFNPFISK